jgi:hypothetical protein
MSKRLYDGITSQLEAVTLNGSATARYSGNLNLSFACVEGESLLMVIIYLLGPFCLFLYIYIYLSSDLLLWSPLSVCLSRH